MKRFFKKNWFNLFCVITIVAVLATTVNISDTPSGKYNVNFGGKVITLGNPAYAAGALDYEFDGIDDDVQFQAALNALPATGGQLVVVSATTIVFGATVTRAIDNVTITGSGRGTYFTHDAATALFTAGGNNWVFFNLRVDTTAAQLVTAMGATTGWSWENVTTNDAQFAYRTDDATGGDHWAIPTGRGATYVIATSDASAINKAQADVVLTGANDFTILQAAINTAQASGGGKIKIIGNNVILGATGIVLNPAINDTTLEFVGVNIQYSGTGKAITLEQPAALTKNFHPRIIGGVITATGAGTASATAIGISAMQWQYGYINCTIAEFNSGTAIKFASGGGATDFAENNHFNVYINNCKNGIYFTGTGGTDYNTIDYIAYVNDVADTGGYAIKTDDTHGTLQLEITNANIWLHQNDTIGLDLIRANVFHISSIKFEGGAFTGCIGIKTSDISIGSIENLMAAGGTGNGKVFDLFVAGSGTPDYVNLGQYRITYMNANFAGVKLSYSGIDVNVNPWFTTDLTGYFPASGVNAWEAAEGSPDNGSLSHIHNAANVDDTIYGSFGYDIPAIPNTAITLLARVKTATLESQVLIGITTFDAAHGFLDNYLMGNIYVVQPADGWSLLAWNTMVPANARFIRFYILTQKGDNTTKTYFDSIQFIVQQNEFTKSTFLVNHGTATLLNTATTVVFAHGLAGTPTWVTIAWKEDPTNAIADWWWTADATNITLNGVDPGASNLDFSWTAGIN